MPWAPIADDVDNASRLSLSSGNPLAIEGQERHTKSTQLQVVLDGGELLIDWGGSAESDVFMEGPELELPKMRLT